MQIDMDGVRLFSFLIFMLIVVPGACTWVQFKHDERKMINANHSRDSARNTHSCVSSKRRKNRVKRYYDIYALNDCHRVGPKN